MAVLNKRQVEDPDTPNLDWEGECEQCHRTISRFRGEGDVDCECGAEYNCFGQRLRDDHHANPSNYDDDVSDMEGFERQMLQREWGDS